MLMMNKKLADWDLRSRQHRCGLWASRLRLGCDKLIGSLPRCDCAICRHWSFSRLCLKLMANNPLWVVYYYNGLRDEAVNETFPRVSGVSNQKTIVVQDRTRLLQYSASQFKQQSCSAKENVEHHELETRSREGVGANIDMQSIRGQLSQAGPSYCLYCIAGLLNCGLRGLKIETISEWPYARTACRINIVHLLCSRYERLGQEHIQGGMASYLRPTHKLV
jgi:hypothetical protein